MCSHVQTTMFEVATHAIHIHIYAHVCIDIQPSDRPPDRPAPPAAPVEGGRRGEGGAAGRGGGRSDGRIFSYSHFKTDPFDSRMKVATHHQLGSQKASENDHA